MTRKKKYPTLTAAYLSTAHITESDSAILCEAPEVACIVAYNLNPGFLIVIDLSDPQRFEESARDNGLSEVFITLIQSLVENGHDYLYLSPVGPLVDDLQKFEW